MKLYNRERLSSLEALMFCDSKSKEMIKSSLTELSKSGLRIIYSLEDIPNLITDTSKVTKVILLPECVHINRIFNSLSLYKHAYNLEYIFLSTDDMWLEYMSNIAECYRFSITTIDYEMVHSILYKDLASIDNLVAKMEFDDKVDSHAEKIIDDLDSSDEDRRLALDYRGLREINNNLSDTIKILQKRLRDVEDDVHNKDEIITLIKSSYIDLINESRIVNSTLEQFEVLLSKDVYDKISLMSYENKPVVLYFKTYQEMIHFESFISTIVNVIKIQLKSSVKVLKLYDNDASILRPAFPRKYKVIKDSFYNSDIEGNDYLIKYGNYKKILDKLLSNSVGVNFLLIFDMKKHNDIVTIGNDIEYNICRNSRMIKSFNINPSNTIVNNDDTNDLGCLSWDTYPSYGGYDSEEDQFTYLSSRKIIRSIVNDIKDVIDV